MDVFYVLVHYCITVFCIERTFSLSVIFVQFSLCGLLVLVSHSSTQTTTTIIDIMLSDSLQDSDYKCTGEFLHAYACASVYDS